MEKLEEKPTEILNLTEVRAMCFEVGRKIRNAGYEPDIIVGLARGGWVPARLICDYLLVSDLVSLSVTHWGLPAEKGQEKAQLEHPFNVDVNGKKVLIVDDVTDTGESLELAVEVIKRKKPAQVKTATMQYITESSFKPDFYSKKIEDWVWFLYPWCWVEDLTGFVEEFLKTDKEKEWTLKAFNNMLKKYHEITVSTKKLKEIVEILQQQGKVISLNKKKWKYKKG